MSLDMWEAAARQFEPAAAPKWATPGELARQLDPRTVQTPALDLIDNKLVEAFNTPDGRLIISMPPQEGKSTRASKDFLVWSLLQNPDMRVVTASYGQSLANRNGRLVRNTINAHPELDLEIARDHGAVSEWSIAGHDGGVLSVGRGAGTTGRPADLLVIDDPLKDRKEADSLTIRDAVWDWWTDTLSTRLAPGATVVLILTRWHEDDLAGRLMAGPDGNLWRVLNIAGQADHDPTKGETDVLGREPGEFMQSARRRTRKQWEAIKIRVGSRTWNALYQGRPSPSEGGIIKRDWWGYYDVPLWIDLPDGSKRVTGFDMVLMSWDMAFKDTKDSDYVVGQVWAKRGAQAFLLDQVRGRFNFPETVRQVKQLAAKWPDALLKIIEDKANGTAVIATLSATVPGIIPENPTESKTARVQAVSPFIEARNVNLPSPELAPWVGDFIEEAAAFPNGAHDDMCLIGSTLIATPVGPRRLDSIRAGETVFGVTGPVVVTAAGQTGVSDVVTNAGLTGTSNHPIWTSAGWKQLTDVRKGDSLWIFAQSKGAADQFRSSLVDGACAATNDGGSQEMSLSCRSPGARAFALLKDAAKRLAGLGSRVCAGTTGYTEAVAKSKPSYTEASFSDGTPMRNNQPINAISSREALTPLREWNRYTGKSTKTITGQSRTDTTFITSMATTPTTPQKTSVLSPRQITSATTIQKVCQQALNNASTLLVSARWRRHGIALQKVVVGIERTRRKPDSGNAPTPVFNLSTEDGTYFANGILVHNCDSMSQALKRMFVMPLIQETDTVGDTDDDDFLADLDATIGW